MCRRGLWRALLVVCVLFCARAWAEDGWWRCAGGTDRFGESPVDLSYLNEPEAGSGGFIRASGDGFVHSDTGEPVRFWGVDCVESAVTMAPQMQQYYARRLAKAGINIVRLHMPVHDPQADNPAPVPRDFLNKYQRLVYELKRQGIYADVSIKFPLGFDVKPACGVPGYEDMAARDGHSLLFFEPSIQGMYRGWLEQLLTTPSPYTGLPLGQDPAVALIEIVNEDSFFFYTFRPGERQPVEALAPLEMEFAEWAAEKHGSVQAALRAWGFGPTGRDDVAGKRLEVYQPWFVTRDGLGLRADMRLRMQDQAEFLTGVMRGFYEETSGWMRDELGVKCPIIGTSRRTADAEILDPLDRYANAVCDVMDEHGGLRGAQQSARPWLVSPGDQFEDLFVLQHPESAPLGRIQYAGHPQTYSQIQFDMINRYRTEGPLLVAAYGCLQGVDGFMWYRADSGRWESTVVRCPVMTPVTVGQFPAFALAYRQGLVAEADPVVKQVLDLDSLMQLEGSRVANPRRGQTLGGEGPADIDPLAFYVGRVVRDFGDRADCEFTDLSPYIDRASGTVRSVTGELLWDYEQGHVTVNAPRLQAAAGMLQAAGPLELGPVTIDSGNKYGCVAVVSLTGEPVATSPRVLVQAMTEEKSSRWTTEPGEEGMTRVKDAGGSPILIRNVQGRVAIERDDANQLTVTPLDLNGYPVGKPVNATPAGGRLTIDLLPDCSYYVVEREE